MGAYPGATDGWRKPADGAQNGLGVEEDLYQAERHCERVVCPILPPTWKLLFYRASQNARDLLMSMILRLGDPRIRHLSASLPA